MYKSTILILVGLLLIDCNITSLENSEIEKIEIFNPINSNFKAQVSFDIKTVEKYFESCVLIDENSLEFIQKSLSALRPTSDKWNNLSPRVLCKIERANGHHSLLVYNGNSIMYDDVNYLIDSHFVDYLYELCPYSEFRRDSIEEINLLEEY